MLVRSFWKNCNAGPDDAPRDAVWVEATPTEAGSAVFPRLSAEQIAKSRKLANGSGDIADRMDKPGLTFCFLVATDLSFIHPHQVHYPVHQLWNAYSPFRAMPEQTVQSLDDLRHLELPQVAEEQE